ncbi:MAG: hypothetical protein EAS49_01305 [Brucella intermedia]|nr:MAG: hypothetical protein EAS49_01305 [Brucella intermedia]
METCRMAMGLRSNAFRSHSHRLSWMPGYHGCIVGHSSERRSRMSHYLLASGDLLVIAAIILSVAYLSWKQFSK